MTGAVRSFPVDLQCLAASEWNSFLHHRILPTTEADVFLVCRQITDALFISSYSPKMQLPRDVCPSGVDMNAVMRTMSAGTFDTCLVRRGISGSESAELEAEFCPVVKVRGSSRTIIQLLHLS
jgi:hypothetical protein